MAKICFEVFSVPGFKERNDHAIVLEKQLSNHFEKLDSPTIRIQNKEDYDIYMSSYNMLKDVSTLRYGEIGVWASNVLALNKFVNSDYDYFWAVEDDTLLANNFFELINEYIADLPYNWEIFSPYVPEDCVFRCPREKRRQKTIKAYQNWAIPMVLYTKDAARKILNEIKVDGAQIPYDFYILIDVLSKSWRANSRLEVYTITSFMPQVCDRLNFQTTIQNTNIRGIDA